MRRFLGAVAVLSLVLSVTGQARAANILYFVDGNNGTDQMANALAALSPPNTVTVATSPLDFQTKISVPGAYQLGIFSAQEAYGADYSAALAALATFVQGGGKAIVDSWFTPLGADITPFGATPTGDINGPAVNLTALNGGITNPVALTNPIPPYATFSTGEMLAVGPGSYVAGTFFDQPGNASGTDGEAAVVVGNTDPSVVAGGRSIVNGFLNDTAGAKGEQLYINEINALLTPTGTAATPEPATLTLLGAGIVGMLGYSRVRRRKVVA